MDGKFVDSAEAIGSRSAAIVLFPDDVLSQFPVAELADTIPEHPKRSEAPERVCQGGEH
jgi:hypothetical protein